ncbi:hypothetical protein ACFE04_023373 [Oxalis oulophora]
MTMMLTMIIITTPAKSLAYLSFCGSGRGGEGSGRGVEVGVGEGSGGEIGRGRGRGRRRVGGEGNGGEIGIHDGNDDNADEGGGEMLVIGNNGEERLLNLPGTSWHSMDYSKGILEPEVPELFHFTAICP